MSQIWREYYIFISSTFRDMDAERDAIKQYVIPRLNKHYRPRCVSFHAIDLRVGVNTQDLGEEESENMVLGACFNKIDSSRPFFIGLLGERYGWIPDKDRINHVISALSEQKRHVLYGEEVRSVTELEILYGAIGGNGENLDHSLFFFRDKESYLSIPDNMKADFEDRYNYTLSLEDRDFLADKQKKLKSKIKDICRNHLSEEKCIDYHLEWDRDEKSFAGMSGFIDLVYKHLTDEIDKEIGTSKTSISWYDIEKETSTYLLHKSDKFSQNEKIINTILSEFRHTSRIAIVGKDGCGKTTIVSQLYNKLASDPKTIVLMADPEISPYTNVVENILFYWSVTTQRVLGLEWVDETILGKKNAYTTLYDKFYELVERARREGYRVMAVIDGLESIQTGEDLLWINDSIPLAVTARQTVPGFKTIALEHEGIDSANIFANHEARHNISLPDIVRKGILSNESLPVEIALYSAMFSNLTSKDFSQIRKSGHGTEIEKINNYITSVYKDAKNHTGSLFIYALNFILERMDALSIRDALEYIAISGEGLRLSDLAALLGQQWDEMKLLVLTELMEDFFIENPLTKQWKLKDNDFRKALLSQEGRRQKEMRLLHVIEAYEDDDPIKRQILLKLAVATQNTDVIRRYLTRAYVGDKEASIWFTDVSLALLMKSESWLEWLGHVLPEIGSEDTVKLIFSLYNTFGVTRNQNTLKMLVRMLEGTDINSLTPAGCYTLAYLYLDAYLLYKHDGTGDLEIRGKLLGRTLDCYEKCRSISPGYRDADLLYTTILAEYASLLTTKGDFEKADQIFQKLLIN